MKFIDLLEEDQVLLDIPFISKKRLFEFLSQQMAVKEKHQLSIYQSFVNREKLGSTSLGNGVAIPHGKCLKDDQEITMKLVRLSSGADYESLDGMPVQVVLAMAFPENVKELHKQIMKEAVALFKQHRLYKGILQAKKRKEVIQLILEEHQLCSS